MKGKTPLQIFHEMKNTYADNGLSVFVIQYWIRKFKFGFPSVRDQVRLGRSADAVTYYYISKVKDCVFEDRCITINELVCQTTLSRGTVGTIFRDHLKMTKVCARWIPWRRGKKGNDVPPCSWNILDQLPTSLIALPWQTKFGSSYTTLK